MGKKFSECPKIHPHSKSRPVQTIHLKDLGLLSSCISMFVTPTQEFSPSWNARKRVQERVKFQEIYIFKKRPKTGLNTGNLKKRALL